jgi:hypothetical protein
VVTLEAVDAAAAITSNGNDASRLEDMEVACRRWPTVREALGQVAGRQLRPEMRQQLDDVASDFVGECFEDDLDLAWCGRPACRKGTRVSHTRILAQKLIIVNDLFYPRQPTHPQGIAPIESTICPTSPRMNGVQERAASRPRRSITPSVHLDDGSVGHQWAFSGATHTRARTRARDTD